MVDDDVLRCQVIIEPAHTYLVLTGELDMASGPALGQAIHAAMEADRPVTIDLAEITFLDGGGLAELMALADRLAAAGLPATFGRSPRPVLRYLELTGQQLATA